MQGISMVELVLDLVAVRTTRKTQVAPISLFSSLMLTTLHYRTDKSLLNLKFSVSPCMLPMRCSSHRLTNFPLIYIFFFSQSAVKRLICELQRFQLLYT